MRRCPPDRGPSTAPAVRSARCGLGRRLTPLFALLIGILAGCEAPPSAPAELAPLPALDGVEPLVRQQLGEDHAAVRRLLAADADPAELAQALGDLGRRYHAYELLEPAKASYREARALAPREFDWVYYLAVASQATGELETAAELYREALALRPDDLPSRIRLGEVLDASGRSEEAAEQWRRAIEQSPETALAHYFLGRQRAVAGELDAAVAHFETALRLQPEATRLHYSLAQAYRGLGEEDRAAEHLARMGDGEVRLADPRLAALEELETGAAALVRRAGKAQLDGRPEVALREYRQAVAADPENLEARQGLGATLAQQGDLEGAREQLAYVLERDPENVLARYNLAGTLVRGGDLDAAVAEYRRILEQAPENADARLALAGVLQSRGEYIAAASEYRRILDVDPANAGARYQLGLALARGGDLDGALAAQRRVLELDASARERTLARVEIASILARQGRGEEALRRYDEVLEEDPRMIGALFGRANLLGAQGRYREAARGYRAVLEVDPGFRPARLGEATALVLARDHAAARASLEESLRAAPQDGDVAHALARLLATAPAAEVRDGARALDLAQRIFAAESSLEHGETVAMAFAELGRFADAAAWQERLLADARRGAAPMAVLRRLEENLARYRRDEPIRQ